MKSKCSHKRKRQSRHLWTAIVLAVLLGTGTVILSQERNGSVSGTVIDSHTQAPISGVRIEIPGVGQSTSEESGRFRISNIPPGRHLLQAVQSGMTADPEDRSSWSVVVAPGEESGNVRLRVSRFSVIRGHVRDDRGNPVSGVSVQAMVLSYPQGRRLLVEPSLATGILNSSAETNEKGEYQLALPTGVYYICGKCSRPRCVNRCCRVVGGLRKSIIPTSNAAPATPVAINGQRFRNRFQSASAVSGDSQGLASRVLATLQNYSAGADRGLRDRFRSSASCPGPVNAA